MKLGIDLDNTIIDYTSVFQRIAEDMGIPSVAPRHIRTELRKHLCNQAAGNVAWTRLQAYIYGAGLEYARPFAGVVECLQWLRTQGVAVCIISHKTRYAALGDTVALHARAQAWLEEHQIGAHVDAVFFEVTQADKLWRIQEQGCTHFIDDLSGIFAAAAFPKNTTALQLTAALDGECHWLRFSNWHAISEYLRVVLAAAPVQVATQSCSDSGAQAPHAGLQALSDTIKAWLGDYSHQTLEGIRQLGGAGNNRVYRLSFSDKPPLIAKFYKTDRKDRRNRLHHEWSFLSLIHGQTSHAVPRPMIKDDQTGLGIYALLEGAPIRPGTPVVAEYWEQCIAFLKHIQSLRATQAAQALPDAAEACLSLQSYLGDVQKRRDRWLEKAQLGGLDTHSAAWIENELEDTYQHIAYLCIGSPRFKQRISREQQILSPSDFGLHNAIRMQDGRLGFVDFEYAGWDHPLKALHDFLNQPRIPLPGAMREAIREALVTHLQLQDLLDVEPLIEALTRLKWCYIMMQHQGINERVKQALQALHKFVSQCFGQASGDLKGRYSIPLRQDIRVPTRTNAE